MWPVSVNGAQGGLTEGIPGQASVPAAAPDSEVTRDISSSSPGSGVTCGFVVLTDVNSAGCEPETPFFFSVITP